MGRSTITFALGQGNSPGVLANNDGISAFQFYGTGPGSFGTTACQAVFSLQDAVNKGITNDFADETKATATIEWAPSSSLGTLAAGDVITINVTEKKPNGTSTVVTICTYTVVAGDVSDTTGDTLNTNITAAINSLSYLTSANGTGYACPTPASGNTTSIKARTGLGINLNSVDPVVTVSNSHTVPTTITAFTGGVYSKKAIWYYTISRFFAVNPNGKAWVQFTSSPGSNFAEVATLMNVANGEPRQMAVLNFVSKTVSQVYPDLNALQTQFTGLFAAYNPCEFLYVPNISGVSDISTLYNLQTYGSAQNVTCVISQDGAAAGAQLYVNSGVSISNVGDILGTASVAAVSQDIGEVGAFNISDGTENNIPAFTNGILVSSVASSLLDTLDSYRYLFCVQYTGQPGTYINNDWTSIIQTNAYNRISRNRTIDKVLRQQYIALLPLLKSRIYLNADGSMTQTTLDKYTAAAEPGIEQMVKDGDLSPGNISGTALANGVVNISPTQNVQTQGYIAITYNLLAVDIADNINVTLQFTQKL